MSEASRPDPDALLAQWRADAERAPRGRLRIYFGANAGVGKTFTVRKNSYGVGVERVFPLHSPRIATIELVRPGKVRRAKLYYIREKIGKAAKIKTLIAKKDDSEA